jgi:hypothetical protein
LSYATKRLLFTNKEIKNMSLARSFIEYISNNLLPGEQARKARQKANRERFELEREIERLSGKNQKTESFTPTIPIQKEAKTPAISAGGEDIKSAVGGTKTISQERRDYFRNLDIRELTPFQISTMGGRDAIKKEIEEAKKPSDAEVAGAKKPERKTPPTRPERKQEPAKPDENLRIWRVLRKDGASTGGEFYDTKEQAEAALEKIGGTAVGAVAGIKFPGKTREESTRMRDEYMQRSMERPAQFPKNEEGELRRKLSNLGASTEQQDRYLANLERLKTARGQRETAKREGEKEGIARFNRFKADVEAGRAAQEQLNIYNRQLGSLKKAYNAARRSGDYIAEYNLGEALEEYQAGVPKEMGARKRAAEKGILDIRNQELEEKIRREEEEKKRRAALRRSNPDASINE